MTDFSLFSSAAYYQQVLGALALIVVMAMLLERALSVPFEWGLVKDFLDRTKLRAPIAFLAAWAICWQMKFDVLAVLANDKAWAWNAFSIGVLMTAAVIAGGSKGAVLLFQGVLGFGKEAVDATVARKTMAASLPATPGARPAATLSARTPGAAAVLAAAPRAAAAGMANGVDTNADCTAFAACIVDDGASFVCRYYRPGHSAALTRPEAEALVNAGLSIVPVFEGGGNSINWFTAQQGAADALHALGHAATVGQPAGSAIYFAVDLDASPGQVGSAISTYFQAVNNTFAANNASYRVGIYGSGLVCSSIIGAGLASLGWLSGSKGWRGYTAYDPAATIVQIITSPETRICNGALAVDRDVAQSADFGAFSSLV
jgi:hypothetical protein